VAAYALFPAGCAFLLALISAVTVAPLIELSKCPLHLPNQLVRLAALSRHGLVTSTGGMQRLHDFGQGARCQTEARFKNRNWMKLHEKLASEMNLSPRLILYGDSITFSWRRKENTQTFRRLFTDRYGPTAIMGISRDTTGNLLWRIRHGEAPRLQRSIISLHIGINDLGQSGAYCWLREACKKQKRATILCRTPCTCVEDETYWRAGAESVFLGIRDVIKELRRHSSSPIVVTALFPTGFSWPNSPFGVAVPVVNRLLHDLAANNSLGSLHVVDCAGAVLNNETARIDRAMMPDFLHPSPRGLERWAQCLVPTIDRLLSQSSASDHVKAGNKS